MHSALALAVAAHLGSAVPLIGTGAANPMAIDAAMVQWAANAAGRGGAVRRFSRLARALADPAGLALEEGAETVSARQLFRRRRGNCIAHALLLVSLARELSLPAVFVLLEGSPRVGRSGDLRIAERHAAAALETVEGLAVFDFGGSALPGERWSPVDDDAILAIFESNLGADRLVAGDPAGAVQHFRQAVSIDPESDVAWTNLGVALRWVGDLDGAEGALRRATQLQPDAVSAWRNLVILLEGRIAGERSLPAASPK